jgi:hypothetical protein
MLWEVIELRRGILSRPEKIPMFFGIMCRYARWCGRSWCDGKMETLGDTV